jgi:hypothetical protein
VVVQPLFFTSPDGKRGGTDSPHGGAMTGDGCPAPQCPKLKTKCCNITWRTKRRCQGTFYLDIGRLCTQPRYRWLRGGAPRFSDEFPTSPAIPHPERSRKHAVCVCEALCPPNLARPARQPKGTGNAPISLSPRVYGVMLWAYTTILL